MKHLSIRTRVAIWYSLGIIMIIGAAVVIFTSVISSTVTSRAQDTLIDSVDQVVEHISLSGGKIHISTDINYHRRGSDIAIYNEKGVMISGLLPKIFLKEFLLLMQKYRNAMTRKAFMFMTDCWKIQRQEICGYEV